MKMVLTQNALKKFLATHRWIVLVKAEELIGTLLYLVSHEASGFVNGVVIPVDGAFSAYSGV